MGGSTCFTHPGFALNSHKFKLTFIGVLQHSEGELKTKDKTDWLPLMQIILEVFENTGINIYLLENRFNPSQWQKKLLKENPLKTSLSIP